MRPAAACAIALIGLFGTTAGCSSAEPSVTAASDAVPGSASSTTTGGELSPTSTSAEPNGTSSAPDTSVGATTSTSPPIGPADLVSLGDRLVEVADGILPSFVADVSTITGPVISWRWSGSYVAFHVEVRPDDADAVLDRLEEAATAAGWAPSPAEAATDARRLASFTRDRDMLTIGTTFGGSGGAEGQPDGMWVEVLGDLLVDEGRPGLPRDVPQLPDFGAALIATSWDRDGSELRVGTGAAGPYAVASALASAFRAAGWQVEEATSHAGITARSGEATAGLSLANRMAVITISRMTPR